MPIVHELPAIFPHMYGLRQARQAVGLNVSKSSARPSAGVKRYGSTAERRRFRLHAGPCSPCIHAWLDTVGLDGVEQLSNVRAVLSQVAAPSTPARGVGLNVNPAARGRRTPQVAGFRCLRPLARNATRATHALCLYLHLAVLDAFHSRHGACHLVRGALARAREKVDIDVLHAPGPRVAHGGARVGVEPAVRPPCSDDGEVDALALEALVLVS